jgi:hypothetical protein
LAITLLFAACECAEQGELPGESVADTSLIQSVETSGVNAEVIEASTQNVTEATTAVTEFKTFPPPEDGWTLELLNEVTYINGKDIDLPFCLNDLGEEYRLDEEKNITYFENEQMASSMLFYENNIFGIVVAKCFNNTKFDRDTDIYELKWTCFDARINTDGTYSIPDGFDFNINGIEFGTSEEDLFSKFGNNYTPANEYGDYNQYYSYYVNGSKDYIRFSIDNKKVIGFTLSFRGEIKNERTAT